MRKGLAARRHSLRLLGIVGVGLLAGCEMPERNSYNGPMRPYDIGVYCRSIGQIHDPSRFGCVPPPQTQPRSGTIYDNRSNAVGSIIMR